MPIKVRSCAWPRSKQAGLSGARSGGVCVCLGEFGLNPANYPGIVFGALDVSVRQCYEESLHQLEIRKGIASKNGAFAHREIEVREAISGLCNKWA